MRITMLGVLSLAIAMGVYALPAAAEDGEVRLPASADEAMDRLMDSPRHGEWVDVPVGEGEAALRSWVVYPEAGEAAPVVIVIHEIFGLTDWVRAVADEVAAAGYIAIAPDLLSGRGPGGGGTESFEGDAVRGAIRELERETVNRRLDAARAWGVSQASASERTAVMGFCWGGSASFNYAVHQPELDAAAVFYGTGPRDSDELAEIAAPVVGFYGGDDARVTSTVPATAEAMEELGKAFTAHVYEGAGHGFVRQQEGREGANLAAARQAWAAMLGFFEEHLRD